MKGNNVSNGIKITLNIQKDHSGYKLCYIGYNGKNRINWVLLCYFPSSSGVGSVYKGAS